MLIEVSGRARLSIPPPRTILLPDGREIAEILGGATGTAMSNYLEQKLLEHTLRNVAYTSPATIYGALFTAVSSGETASVTEVTGGSYARQALTFAAYSAGSCALSADATFPTATANWGTVTNWGIYDASTSGNLLIYALADTSRVVNSGDQAKMPATSIVVTFD